MFYSSATGGFYDPAIHGNKMPGDVVGITKEEHAALIAGLSSGKVIATDDNGKPVLADPDPAPLYPDVKSARAAMVAWIDGFLSKITIIVPKYERESFPTKGEAARAFIAGTARPDQIRMIDNEAQTSNRTANDVATAIVARADAQQDIISHTAGLRVLLDEQLEAATDPMQYETILENGKTQALALAQGLGIPVPD